MEVKSGGLPNTFSQKGSDLDEQNPYPHSSGTVAPSWEPCCSFGRRRLLRVRAGAVHRELVVNNPPPPFQQQEKDLRLFGGLLVPHEVRAGAGGND